MKQIKDVPVGVLIIVLSQFIAYGVIYLAKFPNFLELFGIVLGTLIAADMIEIGVKLIRGIDHDDSSK